MRVPPPESPRTTCTIDPLGSHRLLFTIHLTDFCYDPAEDVIRTKGRKEFTRPTIVFSGCLFALILFLAPFFGIEWFFAILGLCPLLALLRPFGTKVLFSKEGDVVRFFEMASSIELDPKKKLHCQATVNHGDSYFTYIYYDSGPEKSRMIESNDFISEENFTHLFGSLFKNLSYEFTKTP